MLSWNSIARRRRSTSPSVSLVSHFEPMREVAHGATGPLHRLQLAHHDPVDSLLDGLAARQIGERRKPLGHLQLGDLAGAHPDESILPRELVIGDRAIHGGASRGMSGCSSKCKRAFGGRQTRLVPAGRTSSAEERGRPEPSFNAAWTQPVHYVRE